MTDYFYDMDLVVDPLNPSNVVANGLVSIYDPADTAGTTLLALKDPSGLPLPNPLPSNANGFLPPRSATVPQTMWKSGGFTGYFNSYKGLRDESVAAVSAAQAAANDAASAASEVVTTAAVDGSGNLKLTKASGTVVNAGSVVGPQGPKGDTGAAGLNGSNVLPTDTAIQQAINDTASATRGALNATYARFNKDDIGTDGLASLGQSNTHFGSGVDTARLDRPQDRIKEFPISGSYANTLVTAVEPIIHQDGAVGIGPAFRAASTIVKSLPGNRDVAILGLGYGSTGFTVTSDRTWDPNNTTAGTNLYNIAVAQIDKFLAQNPKNRLPWVVWQQGETDAVQGMSQATYATYLDQVIQKLRTRYGNDLIFAIVSMTPQRLDSLPASYGPIDAAHVDVLRRWERTCFFYGPGGNTQDGGIHYTAAEQRIIGDKLAEYLLRYAPANVAGTAPVTPTGLTLSQSGQTLTASWNWQPGRVTGTLLEYRVNGGTWQSVAGLGTTVGFRNVTVGTTFTLGTTVDVRVSAINANGTSAPSTTATIALATVPNAPTGLTAGTSTTATQPLTWTAVSGATSYQVEYKATSSGTWLTGPTSTTASATVTGLTSSSTYDYRVKAVNAAGTSSASATVTSPTQAPAALSADVGTTPLWAYGTRKMVTGYSGSLVRVRRSSDNTEQDIGQTAFGDLDQTALTTFVGANSAYVTKWYNQGTAGTVGDMVQATTTKQPRIVNAGTVDAKNGKVSVYFDGTRMLSHSTPAILAAGMGSILHVASTRSANTMVFSEATGSQSQARWIPEFSTSSLTKSFTMGNDANVASAATGSVVVANDGSLHQGDTVDTGTAVTVRTNGAVSASGAITRSGVYTPTKVVVGAWGDPSSFYHIGYISEIAVWNSALTTTARDNGAANQKAFYATP